VARVVILLLGILAPLLVIGAPDTGADPADETERLAAVSRMPKLALVIDDLGQHAARDARVLALPGPPPNWLNGPTRQAKR
jgi:hypothetical protein